jgi:Negative regulator of genetic competence (MecA).
MDMRYIGRSSVALYLNSEDLKERQLEAKSIDLKQAAELLDIDGWESAEFELFAGQDSVFLIAWDRSLTPYSFSFETFEDMISAVSECPEDQLSKLILCGDEYILTVYPQKGAEPSPVLYEFGEMIGSCESFVLHLEEHGETILAKNAVDLLKSILNS